MDDWPTIHQPDRTVASTKHIAIATTDSLIRVTSLMLRQLMKKKPPGNIWENQYSDTMTAVWSYNLEANKVWLALYTFS